MERLTFTYPTQIREEIYTALGDVVARHDIDVIESPVPPDVVEPLITIHNSEIQYNEERVTWVHDASTGDDVPIITEENMHHFAATSDKFGDRAGTRVWGAIIRQHYLQRNRQLSGTYSPVAPRDDLTHFVLNDEDGTCLGVRADRLRLLNSYIHTESVDIQDLRKAGEAFLRAYLGDLTQPIET
jgi:hypothetical protein